GAPPSHLDLHPGNVVLTDRGPVVIDWETAEEDQASRTQEIPVVRIPAQEPAAVRVPVQETPVVHVPVQETPGVRVPMQEAPVVRPPDRPEDGRNRRPGSEQSFGWFHQPAPEDGRPPAHS
ncbi:phosphotransferase family protein, partial [Streptomyces zaomyceticus]|uniref:phosphotransferase family protein n=1 Tax=Streptomyces zaomyceticus TaxID=68286 RepID=UPI00346DFDF1